MTDVRSHTWDLSDQEKVEKYFRPSCLPVLNNQPTKPPFSFDPYYGKTLSEIVIPSWLMAAPKDTIRNYFYILQEAANFTGEKSGGCGTVGMASLPYPIAYQFLTTSYQNRLPFQSYVQTFQDIGHINLIKLNKVPADQTQPDIARYFIEIETIEGSTKKLTYFAYYYGFIYIKKEGSLYKIDDIEIHGEDFLCAAYHGWHHNAEAVVDIEYGGWCKLVKRRYPTQQEGYIKYIYFLGTDGNDYCFIFFQLTNGTDILIAQYKKTRNSKWELIEIDPKKCLKEK
ncbi:hypothetical protein [Brevibacillus daliensis]|uniref:hypothetical protein n=1 Tax=Brevibacillus daliensis TaxID=2892995 RepID=UPI001E2E3220|nr:hypothetical protein [Brevibacillus daliensis]